MNTLYHILFSIGLSLLSATIFWLTFSFYPKRERAKKIRPKINQDLDSVNMNLVNIFRLIFKTNSVGMYNKNVTYNEKVLKGTLTKEDIELGLQNKCYDINKLKDFPLKPLMISIGEEVDKNKELILFKIEELYFFSEFLKANEIIVLERMKKILSFQNIKNLSDRNLSAFAEHFSELYNLFLDLNEITYDGVESYIEANEFYDISFPLYQVDYYFYRKKDVKKSKRVSEKYINAFPRTDIFRIRVIICEYELGKTNQGFKKFKEYIKGKKNIATYSNIVQVLAKYDDRIMPYLQKVSNEEDYSELINSMENFQVMLLNEKKLFIEINEKIKEYFN